MKRIKKPFSDNRIRTPNINIFRDPRQGRGQKTYGEDPFLTASIPVKSLAKRDEKAGKSVVPAGNYSLYAGGNSENEAIITTFEIK
jgi:hypothetical protein